MLFRSHELLLDLGLGEALRDRQPAGLGGRVQERGHGVGGRHPGLERVDARLDIAGVRVGGVGVGEGADAGDHALVVEDLPDLLVSSFLVELN